MDWQQIGSLGIVAATAAAFAWRKLRRGKSRFAREPHCGCLAPGQTAFANSIVYRAKKGERPQVLVKWR